MFQPPTRSAETVLNEIQSESLQTLLVSVAVETSPPGSALIPQLDAHLFTARQPGPSAQSSFNRGDVVEIQGPAASGKTHLLYHLLTTCLMPSSFNGWNKAAVVLDVDGTFDVHRLQQLFISRLSHLAIKSGSHSTGSQLEEIGAQCLQRLHIFRPTSSSQLAATVLHLDTFHATHLSDAEIGLLAIDSISALYWPDRFTVEQVRTGRPQFTADPTTSSVQHVSPIHHLLCAIQRFRLSHGSVTVLTNWGLNALPDSPFYKQHLHPFPVLLTDNQDAVGNAKLEVTPIIDEKPHLLPPLTHQITIPFTPVTQLQSPTMSTERETSGPDVLEKRPVLAIVRTSGNTHVGRFSFKILENELLVDENSEVYSDLTTL